MPELPEVETTRRHLAPYLVGARVGQVIVERDRMVRRQEQPADFRARLEGRSIGSLGRHGKFLMADVEGDLTWVTHLGMSGRIQLAEPGVERDPHTNVIVRLESGPEFRMVDPRTFGFVVVYTPEELAASPMSRLGPDALTDLPSPWAFVELLAARTAMIKPLLLDQSIIAGLGNIYADEALARARITPTRPGGTLAEGEIAALRTAIKVTLDQALAMGGTSLDDLAYLLPDGRTGEFVDRLEVYGREGEPCGRCGGEITRATLRQRSTFWCPNCQN